jgi:TolA-binding protein
MMNKTAICSLIMCSLLISCVSIPPPSTEEVLIFQRARDALARGDHDWVLHDMEKYLQNHPRSSLSAEAHLLTGEAFKGKVDIARREKEITGIILTTYTSPLVRRAYENYMTAASEAMNDEVASEALFKAAIILDIGYMRNFEKALVIYGNVISKFPRTTWAERAQLRYDNLEDKFGTIISESHRIPGKGK